MIVLSESHKFPYTVALYQGSVKVALIDIVPGTTEEEIGNWVRKHVSRAEYEAEKI